MKQTRLLMGMPVTVEIIDPQATKATFNKVYDYFAHIDATFSTYKPSSEISRINAGRLSQNRWSPEMAAVLQLCEQTKQETNGYFDIFHNGQRDPSGLVKGWAIHNAAEQLHSNGYRDFYIEAGGDVQLSGHNASGNPWQTGIRNPFNRQEIIKVLSGTTEGIATSGSYIRGQHIYNPHALGNTDSADKGVDDVVSLTVVGPTIYEADRFATAAFAMGRAGIQFIEQQAKLEGYMIDQNGAATLTSGFERYVATP